MAINVKFLKGTSAGYTSLEKNADTFYYTTDDSNLYLGEIKLSNAKDLSAAISRIATTESDIERINEQLTALIGDGSGSVSEQITTAVNAAKTELNQAINAQKERIDAIENVDTGILAQAKSYADNAAKTAADGKDAAIKSAQDAADAAQADVDALSASVGDASTLTTTAKTVVGAIEEVKTSVDNAKASDKVTMVEKTSGLDEGIAKAYTFYQGEQTDANKIGTINLLKDLVVSAGEVVKNPEGKDAGTYLKLTIANQAEPVYINVLDLVNDFTVKENAGQIQLVISDTREISASIVAGSVGSTEHTDGAVVTNKVADGAVTKAKLDPAVQASLEKADAAATAVSDAINALDYATAPGEGEDYVKSITEENGVIAPVYGTFNFDEKGAAATAEKNAKDYADSLAVNYDAAGSAATAEANAKAYVDAALTWGTF